MIVKVCGVRTAEVAVAAVDAGADWLGLVFEERSVRHVGDRAAAAVVEAVAGRADLVGVLVEPAPERCDELAARFGLSAVQVHGSVDRNIVERCQVPVIRGINPVAAQAAFTTDWWPDGMLLVDAPAPAGGLPGGTGRPVSLAWAAEVSRHRRIILAGGLGPANVSAAIAAVQPWGVDASSGLERSPGDKDPEMVAAYVVAARAAGRRILAGGAMPPDVPRG